MHSSSWQILPKILPLSSSLTFLLASLRLQRHKANAKAEESDEAASKLSSSAAVSRRLHSAVTASARMKQRASEGLGAIWAEIEAAEEEDALAEMGEGGGAGRHDGSKFW